MYLYIFVLLAIENNLGEVKRRDFFRPFIANFYHKMSSKKFLIKM